MMKYKSNFTNVRFPQDVSACDGNCTTCPLATENLSYMAEQGYLNREFMSFIMQDTESVNCRAKGINHVYNGDSSFNVKKAIDAMRFQKHLEKAALVFDN